MAQTTPPHKSPLTSRWRKGFLGQVVRSMGMRLAAAGLTFAVMPVGVYALGVKGFGEYSIAIAWLNILVVIAKLGFDTASLRYIPQYRSQGETRLLRGFVKTSRRLTVGASIAMALGMVAATLLLRERLTVGLFWSLLFAASLLPLVASIQLREASLLACGRVMAGQLGGILLPSLLILLMGAVPLIGGVKLTSSLVVLLNLGGAIVTLGVLGILSRQALGESGTSGAATVRMTEWVSVSSPLLLVQLLYLLQNQSGVILCGWMVNEEAAGIFAALSRVASVLLLGLQAIGMIAAPTIASLYHSGRMVELDRYIRRCALASFGFAGAFAFLMLAGGRLVLGLFGDELIQGYVPLVVLLGGLAVASAAGPVNQLLMMTGRQWDCIRVYGVVTSACFVMAYFVIPAYGVLGTAVVAALGRIASAAALVLYARYRHSLWCLVGPLSSSPDSPEPAIVPPRAAA